MKPLLAVSGLIELATGAVLLAFPGLLVSIMLGAPLETATAQIVCRMAGVALIALGVACWRARSDVRSPAAIGVATAMLIYDAGAVGVLVFGRVAEEIDGIGFWPAAALHSALALWCIVVLGRVLDFHKTSDAA